MYWSDWVGMNKGRLDEFGRSEWVEPTVRIVCYIIEGFLGLPNFAARRVTGFCRRVSNPASQGSANYC